MQSIKKQAVSGVFWTTGGTIVGRMVQFGSFVILGRILGPEEFGLMSLSLLLVGFMRMFVDMGFGMALIQQKDLTPVQLDSVFWMTMGVGLSMLGLLLAFLDPITVLMRNSSLLPLLKYLSLIFVIDSLRVVPQALITRDLRYRTLAIINLASVAAYGVLAIPLALLGYGVMSLVSGFLASSCVSSFLMFLVCGWFPRFRFSFSRTRSLFRFGFNFTGATFMGYLSNNLERYFLGKYVGVRDLGYYHFASRLIYMPRQMLAQSVGKVVFPLFSKIQDDDAGLKRNYLFLFHAMLLVALPFLTILALQADYLVTAVFGDKWSGAVLPVRILTAAGILTTVGSPLVNGYLAKGKSHLGLFVSSVSAVLSIPIYGFAWHWGITGICVGCVIHKFIGLAMIIFFSARAVHAGFRDHLAQLVGPVIITAVGVLAALGSERFVVVLFSDSRAVPALAALGAGLAVSLFLFTRLEREIVAELSGFFKGKFKLLRSEAG